LHQPYLDDVERCSRIKNTYETQRFVRRWLGWNLDVEQWLTSMRLLQSAGVDSATLALQMFNMFSKIVTLPKELWRDLLDSTEFQERDGTH